MKFLGISGSPLRDGNTAYAVRYALDKIEKEGHEVIYLSLAEKKVSPCIGCFRCRGSGECWQKDDMAEILKLMISCDGIIMGSPVYFGMVSSQLKSMMDRCVATRVKSDDCFPMSQKIGAAIACGNSRNGGQETTITNIHTFMMQLNMKVINDGPGYCHAGGTIVGQASIDEWGLETVNNLAMNLINQSIDS